MAAPHPSPAFQWPDGFRVASSDRVRGTVPTRYSESPPPGAAPPRFARPPTNVPVTSAAPPKLSTPAAPAPVAKALSSSAKTSGAAAPAAAAPAQRRSWALLAGVVVASAAVGAALLWYRRRQRAPATASASAAAAAAAAMAPLDTAAVASPLRPKGAVLTPNGSPTIPNRHGGYDTCDDVTAVHFAAMGKAAAPLPPPPVNGGAEFDDCGAAASPEKPTPSVARLGWQSVH